MPTKLRPSWIIAAFLLGLAAGSIGPVRDRLAERRDAVSTIAGSAGNESGPGRRSGAGTRQESASSARPSGDEARPAAPDASGANASVYAGPGLNLEPFHSNGGFVGYRVLQSTGDSRFSEGDIIVAIAGRPVEDSAAGGELLIAALVDPSVEVEVYRIDED